MSSKAKFKIGDKVTWDDYHKYVGAFPSPSEIGEPTASGVYGNWENLWVITDFSIAGEEPLYGLRNVHGDCDYEDFLNVQEHRIHRAADPLGWDSEKI